MNLLNLHGTNRICPRCKNPNYMVSLVGVSDVFQYKCINCNSYFTFDDLTSRTSTIKKNLVEVVRCKDCKHGQYAEWDNGECTDKTVYCDGYGIHKPDWFCADGERRTDETVIR